MGNRYQILKAGTGKSPHLLQNVDNSSDVTTLCSCGGTSNPDSQCDGSHNKKSSTTCSCHFCKSLEDRIKEPIK